MSVSIVQKYNVPGPRYTSYPTVPYWEEENFHIEDWKRTLLQSFKESNNTEGISLYIHLPFCESLCTFCGCNKRITKRHEVEDPYIAAVIKEWKLYCDLFPRKPIIKEIHLGGGTPTFFSPENLEYLIKGIFQYATKAEDHEFSFEGHPNNTTKQHLQTLYNLGFRRVSFGVQDYSPKVQEAIHRIQPFHNVAKVTFWAKEIGYTSIGHDLIFGLPFQTLADVKDTIDKTKSLQPDRLAFYSYAHVPWIKGNGQRGFKDEDLPKDDEKRMLYEEGKKQLAQNGYHEIGMDHFALPTDELGIAAKSKNLHRNFMGYTTQTSPVLIGLGMSAISDAWYGFAQNEHSVKAYLERLEENELPITRGHELSEEDLEMRQHILNLMCHFETEIPKKSFIHFGEIITRLFPMIEDGLVSIEDNHVRVSEKGIPFVRNCCMAFDTYLRNPVSKPTFSHTI